MRLRDVISAIDDVKCQVAVAQKQRVWSTYSSGALLGMAAVAVVLLLSVRMFERPGIQVIYLIVLLLAGGWGAYWITGPAPQTAFVDPMYRARDLLSYGRYGQAVKAARANVEEHPQEAQPLSRLTYILWQSGWGEEARAQL